MTHLYVCEFSNGTIKVGRSRNPEGRIAEHAARVFCVGIDLAGQQIFECMGSDLPAEAKLIRVCAIHAAATRGNEWFIGLDFGAVCEWARDASSICEPDGTLRCFLNSLSVEEQTKFARACGTTTGYFRKAISKGQKFGEGLCMKIEANSSGAVTCESLRPDFDWTFLRGVQADYKESFSTQSRAQQS